MSAYLQIRIPVWLDKIIAWPILLYRRLRYNRPFRRIPLGQNLFALVDPDDYYWLNQFHWSPRRNSNCVYAVRFLNLKGRKNKIISMHREICKPSKGRLVDHRNNNTLDNCRHNLRTATHSQNQYNKKKTPKKTSSRYIGVYLEKSSRLWATKISRRGKSFWLGRFKSETDAALAYDNAARKYHGQFARLNFTEGIFLS